MGRENTYDDIVIGQVRVYSVWEEVMQVEIMIKGGIQYMLWIEVSELEDGLKVDCDI